MHVSEKNLNRGSFIGGSAVLATAGVLSAAPAAQAKTSVRSRIPEEWDYEADLVIVGAGGAGYMAACAAQERGASSLLIEKASHTGGDTAVSQGIVVGPWPRKTLEDGGVEDSVEAYIADQKNSYPCSHKGLKGIEAGDASFFEKQASLMPDTFEWLTDVAGIEWKCGYYSNSTAVAQPGWETVMPRDWTATTGIIPPLRDLADASGNVETLLNTEAFEIIMNDEGRAAGVWAIDEEGRRISAKARKAVVLSTGTFSSNRSMVFKYLGPTVSELTSGGSFTNTGDGHNMALRVGGTLRYMDLGTHWIPYTVSEIRTVSRTLYSCGPIYGMYPQGILVNYGGRRFCSEAVGYSMVGEYTSEQDYRQSWYVIDSQAFEHTFPRGLDGEGIVAQADTLEELAPRMQVDVDAFLDEVQRYNGFIDAGQDADFGKELQGCARIEKGPFYAVPVRPKPYATYGGVTVDLDGHVLDADGDAIPGLYAAGLVTGSFAEQSGIFYSGGVSQSLAFGRLVGQNAAAE